MAQTAQVAGMEEVQEDAPIAAVAGVPAPMDVRELLKGYRPVSDFPEPDVVGGRFRILIHEPLSQYDTELSEAYAVEDLQGEFADLYALTQPNYIPIRYKAVEALKTANSPSLTRCYAAAPTYLSNLQEVRMAFVLQRPVGQKLSELVKQHGAISERVVILNVLKPICEVLSKLHERGVNHGCINPDTVYVGQQVMLAECVAEPSGYSQDYHYEPPERITLSPYGKGSGDLTADLYALGVLALYLANGGKLTTDKLSPEELQAKVLEAGAYNSFAQNPELSVNLLDFCQGVLTQHPHERWGTKTAISCLQGKRYNLIPPSPPKDSTRSFPFDGKDYYSMPALANAISNNWAEAKLRLEIGNLIRWIERGVGEQEVADMVAAVLPDPIQFEIAPKPIKDVELTRALAILDPEAPIHIKDISVNVDALGMTLAKSFHDDNQAHIRLISTLIEQAVPKFVTELLPGEHNQQMAQMLWNLQNTKIIMNNQGLGMGFERILYQLNPALTCQATYLKSYYVSDLKEALETLDRVAADTMSRHSLLDRHLAAFLMAKMEVMKVTRVVELARYSDLANDKRLVMLKILSQAQKKIGNPPLRGLAVWALDMVMPVIESVNNVVMRERLKKEVQQKAESGILEQIAFSLFNPETLGRDQDAFSQVTALCEHHLQRIAYYRDEKNLRLQARETGRSMSIVVAYLILVIVIYFVFKPYIYL